MIAMQNVNYCKLKSNLLVSLFLNKSQYIIQNNLLIFYNLISVIYEV